MGRSGMFAISLVLGGVLSLVAVTTKSQTQTNVSPAARELHFQSIVVDTHDDTTQRLLDPKFDFGARHSDGSVDIPRMRAGGLSAIFFSIWIPGTVTGPTAVQRALDQIAAVRETVARHPNDLVLCTTAEDIRHAKAAGKIAVLLGVEGGHMINNSLANLDKFFALGVRYMTLTHTVNTDWADASTDKAAHNGLTDFGKQVVREMNRLGMMIDISHVADKTFWDALGASSAPLIASHSSCRALCDVPRNMTDEMIVALAKKGGVVQVNFNCGFLSQRSADAGKTVPSSSLPGSKGEDATIAEYRKMVPPATLADVVAHIDHIVKIAGVGAAGIGSDFDGVFCTPVGLEDVSKFPSLTRALLEKGYSAEDIRKIYGENTLRVMRAVEAEARKERGN